MKKYEKEIVLNCFVKGRIEENSQLFTKEDLIKIEDDFALAKKLYLLGFINCKDTYL